MGIIPLLNLQVLKALARAKSRGFSDVLYLDSVDKKNLEEVSSCNIFVLKVSYKKGIKFNSQR